MIKEIDAKVTYPDFWTTDFFTSDAVEFEIRPMWNEIERTAANWYQKYKEVGVNKDNPQGIKWSFLYDNLYYSQGYAESPKIEGFHINRWWISKIDTGCMLPYHIDARSDQWDQHMFSKGRSDTLEKISHNLLPADEEIVLWVPLQNYKRGHILLYEDTLINNYDAGKPYIFPKKEHAVANMSFEAKLSMVLMVIRSD